MEQQRQFFNGLRILFNLDRDDMVKAGVIEEDDFKTWIRFRDDPVAFAIRCGDEREDKLWALMKTRMR